MFKVVIQKIFNDLNNNNIQYLIERNYKELPLKVGNDIDMLISVNDLKTVKTMIKNILIEYDYVLALDGEYLGTNKLIFINRDLNEEIIRFDLNYMFHYLGIEYLDVNSILNNRVKFKGFFIPSKADEIVMSLFTNYINNGFVKEKYKDIIIKNVDLIKEYPNLYLTDKILNELIMCLEREEWERVNKLSIKVKVNIIKYNWIKKERNNFIEFIKLLLSRVIKNRSKLIIIEKEDKFRKIQKCAKDKGMKCILLKKNEKKLSYLKILVLRRLNSYLFFSLNSNILFSKSEKL